MNERPEQGSCAAAFFALQQLMHLLLCLGQQPAPQQQQAALTSAC